MPCTSFARLACMGRTRTCSIVVFIALCAFFTATSIILPASTAHACDVTRRVFNKSDQNVYVELWRGQSREWSSTDPIKPGAALTLKYLTIGDSILLTGPEPVREWGTNSFGVVLNIFRCDLLRISGTSKLGGYDVKVSRRSNADILVEGRR